MAFAIKHRQQQRAVLTTGGDGSSSQGDFYEAINLAGTWNLPLVFVINNNQWAISVPRDKQTSSETIAQKAIAAGFQGIQVDGNDIVAVRESVLKALDKARNGGGPTLIEAVTFRLCDHTTADDASRYQPENDVSEAEEKEPLKRMKSYLEAHAQWDDEKEIAMHADIKKKIKQAVTEYENIGNPKPASIFANLYGKFPVSLYDQLDELGDQS